MLQTDAHSDVDQLAQRLEASLDPERRKALGQYFTGIKLGRLLAGIACDAAVSNVLDPMAGTGDLLKSTAMIARDKGVALSSVDGIELDKQLAKICCQRLTEGSDVLGSHAAQIISGNSFSASTLSKLASENYDLVIANPPYVRYQNSKSKDSQGLEVRNALGETIRRCEGPSASIWTELVDGYSGLADLSVPAWILAAYLTRPGGTLALVIPATWRNRQYSAPIRYLMLRFFDLKFVVEDTHPGWFSDAQIRTHLIVATRKTHEDSQRPLAHRDTFGSATWVQISPAAANSHSLVGASFPRKFPELAFANWLCSETREPVVGIDTRPFELQNEWTSIRSQSSTKKWFQNLEPSSNAKANHAPGVHGTTNVGMHVPELLAPYMSESQLRSLVSLSNESELCVGQGLRTGCNRFFYVTPIAKTKANHSRVRGSSFLDNREFEVPDEALRPVLRKQTELLPLESGHAPVNRVLDLRKFILPEDFDELVTGASSHAVKVLKHFSVMPAELAEFVRIAANKQVDEHNPERRIPDLSAVRTNVRPWSKEGGSPRYWYMLPDFTPRHAPMAFVPRINHESPWTEANLSPPVLVDANFSTIWTDSTSWSAFGIKALLNSIWVRCCMEAIGTIMGGGALKLEAAHLKQIPIPEFDDDERLQLDELGASMRRGSTKTLEAVDLLVIRKLLEGVSSSTSALKMVNTLYDAARDLRQNRQKVAS